jgi:hypothetical protein
VIHEGRPEQRDRKKQDDVPIRLGQAVAETLYGRVVEDSCSVVCLALLPVVSRCTLDIRGVHATEDTRFNYRDMLQAKLFIGDLHRTRRQQPEHTQFSTSVISNDGSDHQQFA